MSETQDSGGHEIVEGRKRKKNKNKQANSENFDENGCEESPGRKEKKKKNAGIEAEEVSRKSSKKRKSKGLLDGEVKERSLRNTGSENDQFNGNLMEEKLPEYTGSEIDSFRENSMKGKDKDKGATYNDCKKARAIEECVRGKGIGEQHIAENEKKSKKKHRNLMEEFEQATSKSRRVDKSMRIEESAMKEKPSTKKKKKIIADVEDYVAELQNSEKSASIERTEEDSAKKKKKATKEKGSYGVTTEEVENPVSSSKAKSKEKRKKKRKEKEMVSGDDDNRREVGNDDKSRRDADKSLTDDSPLFKKRKKVSFADELEVCVKESEHKGSGNLIAGGIPVTSDEQGQLVWGKRFSPEEDQAIRDAVSKYIKEHGLDEDKDLDMILNSMKHPKVRNCWKEIALALPWRPYKSVYIRGHMLYERSIERRWTQDEINELKRLCNAHGKKWSKIAKVLGKSRYHVKDKWRVIRRGTMKKGHMSQDEYERLFYLVNYNKKLKQSVKEEEHTNRLLRDNINWEAIADKMETRDHIFCCKKWYSCFESPLITANLWENGDDKILLRRLLETNASDEQAVDWDNLVKGRHGEICVKRWKEMIKHSGEYHSKPFCDKLDVVVRRFAPELFE